MAVIPLYISDNRYIDYDIILTDYMIELLNRLTPIKKDEEYVNDYLGRDEATERNIRNYKDCPVFQELKADMEGYAIDIANEIKQLPGILSVGVDRSDQVGLSTYIDVKFKHPEDFDDSVPELLKQDPDFINKFDRGINNQSNGLQGEYLLKFRLSTHRPGRRGTKVHYDIDISNKKYSYFKNKVLDKVIDRIQYISNAWDNYKQYGTLPPNQAQRNHSRANAKNSNRAWFTELLINRLNKHNLKESTVYSNINDVINYLTYTNSDINEVLSVVDLYFGNVSTNKLIDVCAKCLSKNIIDYTSSDEFDYTNLINDMQYILNK